MSSSKNDIAWNRLFEDLHIIEGLSENEYFHITADQIKERREPRLMTKFDHQSQLPEIFSNHKLAILPDSRGSYIIGPFLTFFKLDETKGNIYSVRPNRRFQSLNIDDIYSESSALHYCSVNQILHDFLDEKELFLTIQGRMSSTKFSFQIDTTEDPTSVNVENAQIEIDAGFESENFIYLFEIKNHLADDFNIRQLYYPFRAWSNRVSKKIKNIYLTYSNGVFHFREFEFTDPDNFSSIKLIKERRYKSSDTTFNTETLTGLLESVKICEEPKVPFPQANSIERVINLCELLSQNFGLDKNAITTNYGFDPRQTDYYINAGRYLGLISLNQLVLSETGESIFKSSIRDRTLEIVKSVLTHQTFNWAMREYLKSSNRPCNRELVEIMKKSDLYQVGSDITFFRRASTVARWLDWIIEQLED